MNSKNIYNYSAKDTSGKELSLESYKGKVILIVNTASKCGFTPQLEDLEATYQRYKDQGFEILGFPSNNFGGQEPLEGNDLGEFCAINYGVTFKIFDKIDVVGKEQHPLFKFLSSKSENGILNSQPKWNFHKYLIDKNGNVVDYYYSLTKPSGKKITKAIENLL